MKFAEVMFNEDMLHTRFVKFQYSENIAAIIGLPLTSRDYHSKEPV